MDAKRATLLFACAVLAASLAPRSARAQWPAFGRALTTALGDQLAPAIATDGAGGAIVVWLDRGVVGFNMAAQHVLASGSLDAFWPVNGRAVLPAVAAQTIQRTGEESVAIVSDGAGGAIVTWTDPRNALNGQDVYAQHLLASGAIDAIWPANGATVTSVSGQQVSPVIVSDGAGGAVIAWVDSRLGTGIADRDVFAQHVLASGVIDQVWPANGVAVCTEPHAQFGLAIVSDGTGGAILTWNDVRSGNPGIDIYAEHVKGSGVVDPAWPVNGRALSAAPGTQSTPKIISDGAHGAIVTWTDLRDGNNDIYAQRVLASGAIAPGWDANGQPVSISGAEEVSPTLVSDGADGAIVAWGENSGGNRNMSATHLLPTGALDAGWPAGGRRLSSAPLDEVSQGMAADGAGGAVVAWQREFDIFAQHVLASGALDPTFPASGLAVCDLPFPALQHEPETVGTDAGGAIVTWEDTRDGGEDIYAMQVLAVATAGVGDGPPPAIAFAPPNPNPALGTVTLRFTLPQEQHVRLAIYDASGRRVRELASGTQPEGQHSLAWDLRDEAGHAVGAGLYFARLEAGGRVVTQRLSALR